MYVSRCDQTGTLAYMRLFRPIALGGLLLLAGCHSAVIDATLTNASPEPLQLIEVDYPSASFGTQNLRPGESFHYRFKVLGSGPLKLTWTDGQRQDHAATGPILREGDEGSLTIAISAAETVAWRPALRPVP